MTSFLALLLPFGVALFNDIAGKHTHSTNQPFVQIWTGMIILFGLAYSSGTLPYAALRSANLFRQSQKLQRHHPWVIWVLMSGWSVGWMVAFLTLPSGGFLKLLTLPIFFSLVWRSLRFGEAGNATLRKIMVFTLGFCAACLALLLTTRSFRFSRLLSDWTGPLDLAGRHFQHAQVLKAWNFLELWGHSRQPVAFVHWDANRLELLRFMAKFGVWPGALLGATLILAWWAVWSWFRRTVPGPAFTIEMRRMGLALVLIHGVAAVAYVLFNMGLTRQPFGGGLPPYSAQPAWWVLGVALAWVVVRAMRAGKSPQAVTTGRRWRISFMGYGMAGATLATALLLVNDLRRTGNYIHPGSQTSYTTREIVRDASMRVIAENVLAYDLWIQPSEFWAASLLNPKQAGPAEGGSQGPEHSDAERERTLTDALAQWPQTQSLVKYRLTNWPKSKSSLAILAWAITPEIANKINGIDMPGLLTKPRTTRNYPTGPLYAHALGFASLADTEHGQEGLELVANFQLVTTSLRPDASDHEGMRTTLAPEIQRAARDALQAGIKEHRAIGGAIVVVDVQNSEIAALVSAPDFDPNDLSTYRNPYQPDRILNRASSLSFPIGALITPLIAAHGIESGRLTAQTTVNVGTGPLRVENSFHQKADMDSVFTVEDIIAKSNNIGLAKLALQLPLAELKGVSKTLGLGEPLRIPGLTGGAIAESTDWSEWTPAMHARPGQEIETNLIQVLKAFLPIATSGYLRTPTLLASSHREMYGKRVLSPETAATIRESLKLAVSDRGTGPLAQVSGASVAGKTATMRGTFWTDPGSGKRVSRSDTSVFIGMLPAERPKWLVGVVLEFSHGKGRVAGLSAAPVFSQVVSKGLLQESMAKPRTIANPWQR